jgi:hypothetical protein
MDINKIRSMNVRDKVVELVSFDGKVEEIILDSEEDVDKYIQLILSYWETLGFSNLAKLEGREN